MEDSRLKHRTARGGAAVKLGVAVENCCDDGPGHRATIGEESSRIVRTGLPSALDAHH